MTQMQKAAIEKEIMKLDRSGVTHLMQNVRIAPGTAQHSRVPVRPFPVYCVENLRFRSVPGILVPLTRHGFFGT